MQIHELDNFIGDMTESVFFAVDDGTETNRVPASTVVTSMDTVKATLLDYLYPVGSYYETSNTTFDPNTAWGGTWVKEIAGQVHVSAGTGYSVNGANSNTSDGGEATHTLTINEMPSHKHGMGYTGGGANGMYAGIPGTQSEPSNYNNELFINSKGGGQPHNNMQPYIVVNRWHRTA